MRKRSVLTTLVSKCTTYACLQAETQTRSYTLLLPRSSIPMMVCGNPLHTLTNSCAQCFRAVMPLVSRSDDLPVAGTEQPNRQGALLQLLPRCRLAAPRNCSGPSRSVHKVSSGRWKCANVTAPNQQS